MSAAFDLGPWARFADPAPQFRPRTVLREAEGASVGAVELHRVGGRCLTCGVPYSGFEGGGAVVIQIDRSQWHASCPSAAALEGPRECRELRDAWRLRTRRIGATSPEAGCS